MNPNAIRMHANDNVAVAISGIKSGERATLDGGAPVTVNQDIPRGHKLAVHQIAKGQDVLKYGEVIGAAKDSIQIGDHVHVHNLESGGE
jgi:altronate dehydratase